MSVPRTARAVALDALMRVEVQGAYANVILPELLERSDLDARDRAFATELVYGTTRRQRALDFLVDRYLVRPVEPPVRAALRLGAYQLHELGTPPHAAVGATVEVAPARARGLVNAVLRRVAANAAAVEWPDLATELSYPDWIVARLTADLGAGPARAAMDQMNASAGATERPDGYFQDAASQWVAAAVGAQPGERILDSCAAPGGKATAMATAGAFVVAGDINPGRARRIAENVERLGARVAPVVADGRRPPHPDRTFDRVLVDAPCSGLGALRRRPDARWRIKAENVARLAQLQRDLLDAATRAVRPGGIVVYSVCTLTDEEGIAIDAWMAEHHAEFSALSPPADPWEPYGRGARLLPQAAGTDGMMLFVYERPS